MGGGGGTVLNIEGGYFLFERPNGLVVPFTACFLMGGLFSEFDHLFGGAEEDVSKGGDKELKAVFKEFDL